MNNIIASIKEDVNWIISNTDLRKFYNKKILITGATGFIARYFIYIFMELNKYKKCKSNIYVLARDVKKVEKWFGEYVDDECFHILMGNVEVTADIIPEKMDWIFHAAGISNTDQFFIRPVDVSSPNVIGTYKLLEHAKKNLNLSGFIFFSSGAVYGDYQLAVQNLKESDYYPINPLTLLSSYGESKKMGESFCYSFYRQYEIPTKMVRIGHTYGPGIDLDDGHVYSDFVSNVINRKNIFIKGNPFVTRPFTYVRDTVWGILLIATEGKDGEAYNVCNSDSVISIGKLAEILTNDLFTDRNLKVIYKNALSMYESTEQSKITMDTSKLQELGWKCHIGIREGFLRTVKSME